MSSFREFEQRLEEQPLETPSGNSDISFSKSPTGSRTKRKRWIFSFNIFKSCFVSGSSNNDTSFCSDELLLERKKTLISKKNAIGAYTCLRVLGQGSFGKVFLGIRQDSPGELFAIKVLEKDKVYRRRQIDHTLTEKNVMLHCSEHPFIQSLSESFQTRNTLCLVSSFCEGGELFYHLERTGRFPEATAKFYMAQVCDALISLHAQGVCYRDLKPENIFIDSTGYVKLGDFGLARMDVNEYTGARTICGSVSYMSPEMLQLHKSMSWRSPDRTEYGFLSDWWIFGTMLYDMLVGHPPFAHVNKSVMFNRVLSAEPVCFPVPFQSTLSLECQNLIAKLLRRNPQSRLTSTHKGGLRAAKEHAFFSDINFDDLLAKRICPPFVPCWEKNRAELQNFDKSFTSLPVNQCLGKFKRCNQPLSSVAQKVMTEKFEDWDHYGNNFSVFIFPNNNQQLLEEVKSQAVVAV